MKTTKLKGKTSGSHAKRPGRVGGREEGVEGRKERQLEVKIFQVLKQPHEIKPSDYSVKEISIQKDGETESKSK